MALSTMQQEFVDEMEQRMDELDDFILRGAQLAAIWTARDYGTGSHANEIVDADLSILDYDAAQLLSCITLLLELSDFRENQAVTQGDYKTTMARVKRKT